MSDNSYCIGVIIKGVARSWQGSQDFFFRFLKLHVAKRHALMGVWGRPPEKFFLNGAFRCIFGSDFLFKKVSKINIFI